MAKKLCWGVEGAKDEGLRDARQALGHFLGCRGAGSGLPWNCCDSGGLKAVLSHPPPIPPAGHLLALRPPGSLLWSPLSSQESLPVGAPTACSRPRASWAPKWGHQQPYLRRQGYLCIPPSLRSQESGPKDIPSSWTGGSRALVRVLDTLKRRQ